VAVSELLSVVLPVHNAQDALSNKVIALLEFIPDLTRRFEILIVDNGSQDHTLEVAYDLSRIYPQILVAKLRQRLGRSEIVEVALAHTTGDLLFIQDENGTIDSSKFHRLWALRSGTTAGQILAKRRGRPSLAKRLAAWGVQITDGARSSGGLQLIHRSTRRMTSQQTSQSSGITLPTSSHSRVDNKNPLPMPRIQQEYVDWEGALSDVT
jgi:glycosyltransferase involved in cell wall biosynthesis